MNRFVLSGQKRNGRIGRKETCRLFPWFKAQRVYTPVLSTNQGEKWRNAVVFAAMGEPASVRCRDRPSAGSVPSFRRNHDSGHDRSDTLCRPVAQVARDSIPYRPRQLVEKRKGVRCSANGRNKTSRGVCSISLIAIHATLTECTKFNVRPWRKWLLTPKLGGKVKNTNATSAMTRP